MSQFSLEICIDGEWRKVDGIAIEPRTEGDQLRLLLERPSQGSCVTRITNGKTMRKPVIGTAGDTAVPLGHVRDYTPGVFKVYLGSGGFTSEEITYEMNPCSGAAGGFTPEEPPTPSAGPAEPVDPAPAPSTFPKTGLGKIAFKTDAGKSDAAAEELRLENEALKKQVQALQEELEAGKAETEKLREFGDEIKTLIDEKGSIEATIQELREANERAEKTRQELMAKSRQLGLDISDNEAALKEREEQIRSVQARMEEAAAELEEKNAELQARQGLVEEASKHIRETEEKLAELQKASMDPEQSLQELTEKRSQLGLKDQEISETEEKIREAEGKTEELSKTLAVLEKAIAEREEASREKQEESARLAAEISVLEEEEQAKTAETERIRTALGKLNREYRESISEIRERLDVFYKECGLLEKQSKDVNEALRLVETAAEDEQFAASVENITALKDRIQQVSGDLKGIMKEYKETLKKMENSQM